MNFGIRRIQSLLAKAQTVTGNWTFTGIVNFLGATVSLLSSAIKNADGTNFVRSGTWTPIDASGAGLSLTISGTSTYTITGGEAVLRCTVTYPTTVSASTARIGGFPFSVNATTPAGTVTAGFNTNNISGGEPSGTSCLLLVGGNSVQTNANLSGDVVVLEIRYKIA